MKRLEGKTAIVTGGGQGIGEAIVTRFAQEGANVVIAELNQDVGSVEIFDRQSGKCI